MANLATQYFVKAKDNYPYGLEEAIENLNYALSYDENHVEANCLMGRYYAEQVFDFKKAIYHYEKSLAININYTETYYFYLDLVIQINDFKKADLLMKYARKAQGICLACILQKEALISEKKNELKKSKQLLEQAISISLNNDEILFLENELKRVIQKRKKIKTRTKKRSNKTKKVKFIFKYL